MILTHVNDKTRFALAFALVLSLATCRDASDQFYGKVFPRPQDWSFVGDREPCYLAVRRERRPVIRVNCFVVDGVLHTHSNRFADLAGMLGESWVHVAMADGIVKVKIRDRIYLASAVHVSDPERRRSILSHRGYDPIPSGIHVFELRSR